MTFVSGSMQRTFNVAGVPHPRGGAPATPKTREQHPGLEVGRLEPLDSRGGWSRPVGPMTGHGAPGRAMTVTDADRMSAESAPTTTPRK
jgi:hypothetical protein